MADDKIFQIELPQIPPGSAFAAYGQGQSKLALEAITAMARQNWIHMAMDKLGNRRRDQDDYIRAISQPEILPGVAVITLTGKRAHDLEFGRPSYDLRTVLLGPHVKLKKKGQQGKGKYQNKKGGFYRAIPFSHQAPGTLGANGAPIGSQYESVMGKENAMSLAKFVHGAAKELRVSLEQPNRRIKWGDRLPEGYAPKLRPHHTTSIYTSMVRVAKDYKNEATGKTTRQTKLLSFRTISTTVTRGWIMPSTTGLFLLRKVAEQVQRTAPEFLARSQQGATPPPGGPAGGGL